jgi:RNA polymerase sigma-70 factor (TIGR02957 family)
MTMAQASGFDDLRPAAFAVAYRMLGMVAEAEDVVQEALLRLHRARQEGERIESPRAFVSTVVTRLCIDELRSARARRERYVGEWLPEPLVADADPACHAEMADSLSLAFLVLLESLSPRQRAAFLLRDVFDYSYAEIATIIGTSEDNVRQLTTRARRLVEERRPRFEASRERQERLARGFFAAAQSGDVKALEDVLAQDVVLHSDGGGKAPALARAVHGRSKVVRTLLAWARATVRAGGFSFRRADVNGHPGALVLDSRGGILGVMELDIAEGQIHAVRSVVNPDKLRRLGSPARRVDAEQHAGEPPARDPEPGTEEDP